MKAKLITRQVGPYAMNTYVVRDDGSNNSVIIDPGGEPEIISEMVAGTRTEKILLTHGHSDHTLALEVIRKEYRVPVYIHPLDADEFGITNFSPLVDDQELSIGGVRIKVIHVPGHTPGQCCFDLGDGRIIVGDTIFVGGPGRTAAPKDFETTMKTMQDIVFKWPNNTRFYPGHGPAGTIGQERPTFETFLGAGWTEDTHGDVTWDPGG